MEQRIIIRSHAFVPGVRDESGCWFQDNADDEDERCGIYRQFHAIPSPAVAVEGNPK